MSMIRALVLGSNGNHGFSRLKWAKNDATLFSKTLRERCGARVSTLDAVDGDAINYPLRLLEIIERFFLDCTEEDIAVFYFSGHGEIHQGELRFVLDRSNPDQLRQTTLAANSVLVALNDCKSKKKLLVLDCCYAGLLDGGTKGGDGPMVQNVIAPSKRPGFVMIFAAERFTKAREIDALRGSFLTTRICARLREAEVNVDVSALLEQLATDAEDYNEKERRTGSNVCVPIPFGIQRGPLILPISVAAEPTLPLASSRWDNFSTPRLMFTGLALAAALSLAIVLNGDLNEEISGSVVDQNLSARPNAPSESPSTTGESPNPGQPSTIAESLSATTTRQRIEIRPSEERRMSSPPRRRVSSPTTMKSIGPPTSVESIVDP